VSDFGEEEAQERHNLAVYAEHSTHVDCSVVQERVALGQNKVRGRIDALRIARSKKRTDGGARMRRNVGEEALHGGIGVHEDHVLENECDIRFHQVEETKLLL